MSSFVSSSLLTSPVADAISSLPSSAPPTQILPRPVNAHKKKFRSAVVSPKSVTAIVTATLEHLLRLGVWNPPPVAETSTAAASSSNAPAAVENFLHSTPALLKGVLADCLPDTTRFRVGMMSHLEVHHQTACGELHSRCLVTDEERALLCKKEDIHLGALNGADTEVIITTLDSMDEVRWVNDRYKLAAIQETVGFWEQRPAWLEDALVSPVSLADSATSATTATDLNSLFLPLPHQALGSKRRRTTAGPLPFYSVEAEAENQKRYQAQVRAKFSDALVAHATPSLALAAPRPRLQSQIDANAEMRM